MTTTRAKIDASGRVVIPADLREDLGLTDEVELVDTPDGVLLRSPNKPMVHRDEHGLLVVSIGRPTSAEEVRQAIDDDRSSRGGF